MLLKGNKPITCIANDEVNMKLWYGTPDSSIRCIDRSLKDGIEDDEVFTKPSFELKGLPEINEYHLMNNKRYVLTNNSEKKVQLWEVDSGKVVHEFTEPFADVKNLLS